MVRQMLFDAAPQLNLKEGENWWETTPSKFYPFLRELVKNADDTKIDHVFEGDTFFPEHAAKLKKDFLLKACFLGTSQITVSILKENPGIQNWLEKLPEDKLNNMPTWLMEKSKMFESECKKYKLPYFDVGKNHQETLQKAYDSLFIIE